MKATRIEGRVSRDVSSRLSAMIVVRLPATAVFCDVVRDLVSERSHGYEGDEHARVRVAFDAACAIAAAIDAIVVELPNTTAYRDALRDLAVVAADRYRGAHGREWERVHDELEVAVDADRLEENPPIDALEER